ncbi:MAG: class IV adenylate cyclase [Bacteroidetes bacterium]|nr:class IV adenylate cyclase [Bacteroidota bacterium]
MFNKNYEIKCRLSNHSGLIKLIKSDGKYVHSTEKQTDIYYKVRSGRLKLRIINDEYSNLIYYERPEKRKIRTSNYIISKSGDFKQLNSILKKQFEVLTEVTKHRNIFIKDNIRIHIDKVRKLGDFLEIEIIYKDLSRAKKQMEDLFHWLGLDKNNFIKNSYSDLLIKK